MYYLAYSNIQECCYSKGRYSDPHCKYITQNFLCLDNHDTEKENRENGVDFKVPDVPQKRKRGRPRKLASDGSGLNSFLEPQDDVESDEKPLTKKLSLRGRKKIIPMSLKMCSECGEEFQDHASNLTHWKEKHPGNM